MAIILHVHSLHLTRMAIWIINKGEVKENITIKSGWNAKNIFVKGIGILHSFWAYKALWIRIGQWTIGGLNFEFLLSFVFLSC